MTENQSQPSGKPETRDRDEKGLFLPGNSIAKTGGRRLMTWQDHSERIKGLLEKYSTEEIQELVKGGGIKKLSIMDGLLIAQIYRAMTDGHEYERMLSRLIHKPLQKVELTGADGKPLYGDKDKPESETPGLAVQTYLDKVKEGGDL